MSEDRAAAQPGVAPGSPPSAGPLLAALYGALPPHPRRGTDAADIGAANSRAADTGAPDTGPAHVDSADADAASDAYALFHLRSLAMGWLDDTGAGGAEEGLRRASGLWGMNDAGWEHPLGTPDTGLVAWFQVDAAAPADDRPLPVQPLLQCAAQATARAGALRLDAVQLLLPVHGLAQTRRPRYAPVPSIVTSDWFAAVDPRARTPVAVTVDGGQEPTLAAVAERLAEHLGRHGQHVFAPTSYARTDTGAAVPPPCDDRLWCGPPGKGVVLRGALAEWSPDAVGWLAETVADCVARLGVQTPLLLTVAREDRP